MRGWFSRDYEPVETVDPGGSVSFQVPNAGWYWDAGRRAGPAGGRRATRSTARSRCAARAPARRSSSASTRSSPRDVGRDVGHGETFDWALDGDWWHLGERRVRSAPFLGVIGMPPPEPRRALDHPAAALGREHRLQGARRRHDALPPDPGRRRARSWRATATARRATARCRAPRSSARSSARRSRSTSSDLELRSPIARIADAWLAFGFDEDLDLAAEQAHRDDARPDGARARRLARNEALALASVAVDLRVTQVVNQVKGVHAVLRDDAITRIGAWPTSSSCPTSARD